MEKPKPCWICAILALISALISAAVCLRWSNGFRPKKTVPVFGVLVNCSALSPGKRPHSRPFGIHPDLAHFADHRVGARQRRPFRHLHAANEIQLILGGNKPAGDDFKHHPSGAEQQQIHRKHRATASEGFAHQPLIAVRAAQEKAVKRTENPAKQTIDQPVGRSFFAPCGFNSRAASAGESVSELMAEITVEMAMVTANCL